jgi:hypothetical protein
MLPWASENLAMPLKKFSHYMEEWHLEPQFKASFKTSDLELCK